MPIYQCLLPKSTLFGSTRDLREQITFIQQKFPESNLYGVGSSAGTGLLGALFRRGKVRQHH